MANVLYLLTVCVGILYAFGMAELTKGVFEHSVKLVFPG